MTCLLFDFFFKDFSLVRCHCSRTDEVNAGFPRSQGTKEWRDGGLCYAVSCSAARPVSHRCHQIFSQLSLVSECSVKGKFAGTTLSYNLAYYSDDLGLSICVTSLCSIVKPFRKRDESFIALLSSCRLSTHAQLGLFLYSSMSPLRLLRQIIRRG